MAKQLTAKIQDQLTKAQIKPVFIFKINSVDRTDYLVSASVSYSKEYGSASATFTLNNDGGVFGSGGAMKIEIGDILEYSEFFGGDATEFKKFYGIVNQRNIAKSGDARNISIVGLDYISKLQFLDIDYSIEGDKLEIVDEILVPNYLTSPNENLAQLFNFANDALAYSPTPILMIKNKGTADEDPCYDGFEIYYDVGQVKLGFPLNARYNYDFIACSYWFYTSGVYVEDILEDIITLPDGYGKYLFNEATAQEVIDNHLTTTFLAEEGVSVDYMTPNYTTSTITIKTILTEDYDVTSAGVGEDTLYVESTVGFPSTGQAEINGDIFTWSGLSATTLLGIPTTGEYSLKAKKAGCYVKYEADYAPGQVWYLKYSNIITDLSGGTGVDLVPTMSSNTAPSGIASASSEYSSTNAPWKAFNDTQVSGTGDAWMSATDPSVTPQWLQYQFTDAKVINRYIITNRNNPGTPRSPVDWTFLGSNDGVNFTLLDTQVNQFVTNVANTSVTYDLTNITAYTYYRIRVTKNRDITPVVVAIGEMQLINRNDFTIPGGTFMYFDKRFGRILLSSAISTSAIVKCNISYSFKTLQATGVELNSLKCNSRELENRYDAIKKCLGYLAPNYIIRTIGDNKIWANFLSQKVTSDYTLECVTQLNYHEDEDLYSRVLFYGKNIAPTNLMFKDGVDFGTTGESYKAQTNKSVMGLLREEDNYYVYGSVVSGVGRITGNLLKPIVYVNDIPIDNQNHRIIAQQVVLETTTRTDTTTEGGGK